MEKKFHSYNQCRHLKAIGWFATLSTVYGYSELAVFACFPLLCLKQVVAHAGVELMTILQPHSPSC